MKNRSILAVVLLLLHGVLIERASAQSPTKGIEIGAQFTLVKLTDDQSAQFPLFRINDTLIGGGIRIGYNLTRNFTLEAEGNLFKREGETNFFGQTSSAKHRRSEGLFGAKYGKRGDRIGVFGKVRPGFVRFDGIDVFERSPSSNVEIKNNVYFALDAGAVIEVYPTSRAIVRFDFGDTIIRYTNRRISGFKPGAIPILKTHHGHNAQFSLGIGFRF